MLKAVVAQPAGIEIRDVPVPEPGPADVLVRVKAAGLNRAELAMATGAAHGSRGGPGAVMGLEWSGIVESVGRDVPDLATGQPVMCTGAGGWAELAATDWGRATVIPEGVGFAAAAALPTALQTAHNALVGLGRLQAGETVLVHGAGSGVGLMGLQVAREMGAGLVIGTSSRAERRARLADFGAALALDGTREGWAARLLEATGGRGADLVFDLVSGPGLAETMRATAMLGRIVNNGRLGGAGAPFDFDLHAVRQITYIGSSFRNRSREQVRAINARMRHDLWAPLRAGRLTMPIDSVFPLEQARAAQERMRSNLHFGKIVLTLSP